MGPGMTCLGVLGNIVSVGLILSPLPTLWKILQKRSTEKFSPVPYTAIMLSSCLWLFYGSPLVNFGILVETISGFGVGVECAFLAIFFVFAGDKKTRVYVFMLVTSVLLFVGMVVSLTLAFIHEKSRRRTVVGVLAAFVAVVMYASPLSIVRMVIRTKSTKYMPFLLSFVAFLNAALWGSYAILGHDLYIMIPNVLGAGLGIAQLILYASYCRRRSDADIEFTIGGEKIGNFLDLEPGQAPGKVAANNIFGYADLELEHEPIRVAAKISGLTDSDVLQSPGTERSDRHVLFKTNGGERR